MKVKTRFARGRAWPWLIAALSSALVRGGESQSSLTKTAPLAVVLEVQRPQDKDLLFLGSGEQRQGAVQTETVHLRTPHGLLSLPTRAIAGIQLAAGQGGQDTVVTTRRDFFQGFVEDSGFVVVADNGGDPVTIRREKLQKIVFRLRPGEPEGPPSAWLIQLRDGCFFHGRLVDAAFRATEAGTELPVLDTNVIAMVFEAGETPGAQVLWATGEARRVTWPGEDLEFQSDVGAALRLYHGQVREIRRAGPLPEAMSRRLGAPRETPTGAGSANAQPDPGVVPIEGMKWLAPGEFVMGSPTQEAGRDLDEGPVTKVVIAHGFWLCDHEVTQAEYEALMRTNPSQYLGEGERPVEKVNWQEAMEYCRKLTEREQAAGHLPSEFAYRLPTEAEWEYACRAGTQTRFSFGDDLGHTRIKDYAWYGANSDSAPHRVRLKQANPWGLYDLHGNLLEWCLDEWKGALPGGTITNQVAQPSGTLRVARGGSWLYEARFCRSANRDSYGLLNRCSDVGFRVALSRLIP